MIEECETVIEECPWCKIYMEIYLKDNGTLSEKELEQEKERLNDGHWDTDNDIRDEVLGKKLKHFWIISGACVSFPVPICREFAAFSSDIEMLEWELKTPEFEKLKTSTKRIIKKIRSNK